MPCMNVVFHDSVELHQPESVLFHLCQTVGDQLFSDMSSTAGGINGIASLPLQIIRIS